MARLVDEFLTDDGLLPVAAYVGLTPDGKTTSLTINGTLRAWGYTIAAVRSGVWESVERARVAAVRVTPWMPWSSRLHTQSARHC